MLTINTYSNVVKLLGVLVLSWNEVEAKLSTTNFSKAVDFLINLISPVCSKAASVQIFISEYRGLVSEDGRTKLSRETVIAPSKY